MQFIDLKQQYLKYQPEIDARIRKVLEHGNFIMGPEVSELEKALAEFVGIPHAITCASGTDSLEIALRALGIGPGDEVITVPFTWISSAESIALVGAKPVFVDIDPLDYNLDVSKLATAITPKTKVIMPVSLLASCPIWMESISWPRIVQFRWWKTLRKVSGQPITGKKLWS